MARTKPRLYRRRPGMAEEPGQGTLQAPVAQFARVLNLLAQNKSAELGGSPEGQ